MESEKLSPPHKCIVFHTSNTNWNQDMPSLQGTYVNNAVHVGWADDAIAAEVEVDHALPRVGDAFFWHALLQEEECSAHVFQVVVHVINACLGADES